MTFLKKFAFFAWVILLQACFNSEDHIFDETDAIDIKVTTSLSHSAYETNPVVKADTFNINDTIYFIASIIPNKLIKIQDVHWTMDGNYYSSEYCFKNQITEPGHHKFVFILKDHFGDIHSDSVDIWVSGNPTLNDSTFIPAKGTQALDPYEPIYFTWNAQTEGIHLGHYFHFTLSEQTYANIESKFTVIDTILTEPHFIFHNKLNPLKKYNWKVQTFNEYKMASAEKIESFFFTKGMVGEGSLQASIDIGKANATSVQLTLVNKEDDKKKFNYKFKVTQSNREISTGAIPAGKYQLSLQSDDLDFGSIQKDIDIHEGFVTTIEKLQLLDTIAPTIKSLTGRDTLAFTDTLRFVIKDGSSQIVPQKNIVKLETEQILDIFYKDSILTVILKKTDKSWAYRILTVSASDESQNTLQKTFYIEPSVLWFTTNSDTTITNDESIQLFIQDNNPFNFKIDTLKFFNITKNQNLLSISNIDKGSFSAELEASLFESKQSIQSIVIYKNGLKQSKTWTLHVNQAPQTEDK